MKRSRSSPLDGAGSQCFGITQRTLFKQVRPTRQTSIKYTGPRFQERQPYAFFQIKEDLSGKKD